ncbi:type II restriction endonuclease [Mycoplasma yeatsii]|uniref:type II restriction endonuclease n=1 Tax=Mycoplasma yeatsii TaxID=51365 RepID=UPI0005B23BFD|nr:type II restriction endonuclease [Mycoplasma yeatsii]AJM72067.1 DpnII-related restriction endonuclease [Mycoplasma yeatsii GM274B]
MEKLDFNYWISNLQKTIVNWGYFVDFDKVFEKADKYKEELKLLSSIIGSDDIENDFENLIDKHPSVVNCLPILIAIRNTESENKIFIRENKDSILELEFDVGQYLTKDKYLKFFINTGLIRLFKDNRITNLNDYILGVEVGMDTNARKNRSGKIMESIVENQIIKAGYQKDKDYFSQMTIKQISKKFNIDLSKVSKNKRFDFVIVVGSNIYAIECNYYGTTGSKIQETWRSYQKILEDSKDIKNFNFVWVTDGQGWASSAKELEEIYYKWEHLYNIKDLEDGIFSKLKNNKL